MYMYIYIYIYIYIRPWRCGQNQPMLACQLDTMTTSECSFPPLNAATPPILNLKPPKNELVRGFFLQGQGEEAGEGQGTWKKQFRDALNVNSGNLAPCPAPETETRKPKPENRNPKSEIQTRNPKP